MPASGRSRHREKTGMETGIGCWCWRPHRRKKLGGVKWSKMLWSIGGVARMESQRGRWSDDVVIALAATAGAWLGAAGCFALGEEPGWDLLDVQEGRCWNGKG